MSALRELKLIDKSGNVVVPVLKHRTIAGTPEVPEYVVYQSRLYRVESHALLDERNTIVSTYRQVSERVVVYS